MAKRRVATRTAVIDRGDRRLGTAVVDRPVADQGRLCVARAGREVASHGRGLLLVALSAGISRGAGPGSTVLVALGVEVAGVVVADVDDRRTLT